MGVVGRVSAAWKAANQGGSWELLRYFSQMQQCKVSMRGPRWLQQHSQGVSGTPSQWLEGHWSGIARRGLPAAASEATGMWVR